MRRSIDDHQLDHLTLARQHFVLSRWTLRAIARRNALITMVGNEVAVVSVRNLRPVFVREQIERIAEDNRHEDDGEHREKDFELTSLLHVSKMLFRPGGLRVGKFPSTPVVPGPGAR